MTKKVQLGPKNYVFFLLLNQEIHVCNLVHKTDENCSSNVSCHKLASQLCLLNTLSIYLPGAGGNQLYPGDTTIMLPQWQLNFDASGNQLDDTNYSITCLIAYMEQQRVHHDTHEELKKRQQLHKCPPYHNPHVMSCYNNYQPYLQ